MAFLLRLVPLCLLLLILSNVVVVVRSEDDEVEFVDVVISFEFDDFPFETGWSMKRVSTGETLVTVPIGSYSLAALTDERTYTLPGDVQYEIEMEDLKGDGMCCNNPGKVTVLQYGTVLGLGGGPFDFSQTISFTTSQELTAPPSGQPALATPGPTQFRPSVPTIAPRPLSTLNPAFKPTDFPSQSPTCTTVPVTCTLFIQFDEFPEELGWSIARKDTGLVIASRAIGYYGFDPNSATEEIELESEGVEYILKVDDEWNDGFGEGYLTLTQEGRVTLAYGGSEFDVSNGIYPVKTSSECTSTSSSIQTMVALTIDFGLHPELVGWIMTDQENAFVVKASKPVGFFRDDVTPPPPVQLAQTASASGETTRSTFWLKLGATYTFSISMQNVNINSDAAEERVTGSYKLTSVFNEETTFLTGIYEFDGYGDASQSITFTVPNDEV